MPKMIQTLLDKIINNTIKEIFDIIDVKQDKNGRTNTRRTRRASEDQNIMSKRTKGRPPKRLI